MQRDAERARTAIARRNGRGRRAFQKQPTADIPIVDAAPIEAAATATAPTVKAAAAPASGCSPDRKPFHTVLTATAQVYQQWQCRVMYFQWKKQRRNDPVGTRCTEMTGFTRLVAHGNGEPDGLEGEIPSYFVNEYSSQDYQRFHGYRVINRPYSVVQFLKSDYYKNKIAEDYVFIAETDHILTQPLPNKASLGSPMAYIFNYMGPNPAHAKIIEKAWPSGGSTGWKRVQSIGPSPVLLHKKDLERIAKPWEETAVHLKTDPEADGRLGWVIEMWGYAIAAAKIGLIHQEFKDFQVEPGALSTTQQLRGFPERYWIFHYTYQFEYMLDGTPCQPWTIGEYSLDKRHFSDIYPTPPLPEPPEKANPAAFYLLRTFNDAMMNISTWPVKQPPKDSGKRQIQTLYGRRRLDWFSRHQNGFQTEMRTMPLVKTLGGTTWKCEGKGSNKGKTSELELTGNGDAMGLSGSRSRGRWGTMNDPTLGDACPVYSCVFLDFGGGWGGGANEGRYEKEGKVLTVMKHRDLEEEWRCVQQSGGGGGGGMFG